MPKYLFFNFDGTGNEPEDADQDVDRWGNIEDDNITNILKFHFFLGGNLKNEAKTVLPDGSLSFYYNGVGTYGNPIQRLLNQGLALGKWDVARIINEAKDDFKKHFSDDIDLIIITGFSRGAAIARRFATLINDEVGKPIIIEGIFDTVASIGLPNLDPKDRPKTDVVFENHTLAKNVVKALHMLALDEKRLAFRPTLMNQEDKVTEIWFSGAHSDIGGGYFYDGLSDVTLRYFLDWIDSLNLGIKLLDSTTIDYQNLFEKNEDLHIGPDDVQIRPNPGGKNHQQERIIFGEATLSDRKCCVIKNDMRIENNVAGGNGEPLIYWSVQGRIRLDPDYKPRSLKNVRHKILYPDGSEKSFLGFSAHRAK